MALDKGMRKVQSFGILSLPLWQKQEEVAGTCWAAAAPYRDVCEERCKLIGEVVWGDGFGVAPWDEQASHCVDGGAAGGLEGVGRGVAVRPPVSLRFGSHGEKLLSDRAPHLPQFRLLS